MKLTNSLTKQKEELRPLKSGHISAYSCGPTVYDHLHIGNLRAFIVADTLRRALEAGGLKVKWVMNITDVDDKTIHRSLQEHPDLEPRAALSKLTQHYEAAFQADCQAVGVDLTRAQLVRATDSIELMQKLILSIAKAGFAYVADGSVYFDLAAYTQAGHRYGQLSKVDFKPQARIDNDEYAKHQARDFVLWKAVDAGEPYWELELDGQKLPGRPGWHIECSAMAAEFLGQPFDIHTGGIDLIFPHHENELAQSQAAHGQPLANCFVHNEHLLVDGQKMAKRLQNFYTLTDIEKHGATANAFRLLMLMSHYRSQQNFTWEALAGAQGFLTKLQAWAALEHQANDADKDYDVLINRTQQQFLDALNDDLNTPRALAALSDLADQMVVLPQANQTTFMQMLELTEATLGLELRGKDINQAQKDLISQRAAARAAQDWEQADSQRQQLNQQGIELEDTPYGQRWLRNDS